MDIRTELEALLAANVPLIQLVTYEEERIIQILLSIPSSLGVYAWDSQDGFTVYREAAQALTKADLTSEKILPFLADKAPACSMFLLKDLHHSWQKGPVIRKLRNMAPKMRVKGQFLLFLTPLPDLPAELKDDVFTLEVPLPTDRELAALFQEYTGKLDRSILPKAGMREKIMQAALGLTMNQARLAFARVYALRRKFDEEGIDIITNLKRRRISESGALEFWPASEGESSVGGLDQMKDWFRIREKALGEEARQADLPYPRGVGLIGVPGTGKSLTAKMVSGVWKIPLLRLDVGAVFGQFVGQSEEQIRKAIQLAEAVCPCILWIDEMEKAFAGVGSADSSSGAATRVFGTFLTWMQEHQTPVFVLATANNVEGLPPELIGRFDRIFFLDLPNEAERKAIFGIHLKRAGVPYPERSLKMDELVEKSQGYVGREIERVVREAQFIAFAEDNREIEMDDLRRALKETIPISRSHATVIEELRKWKTEGRAFPASSEEVAAGPSKKREIEV